VSENILEEGGKLFISLCALGWGVGIMYGFDVICGVEIVR
jgi:uncharacterized membrane protein YuzA (DUF378 family)